MSPEQRGLTLIQVVRAGFLGMLPEHGGGKIGSCL